MIYNNDSVYISIDKHKYLEIRNEEFKLRCDDFKENLYVENFTRKIGIKTLKIAFDKNMLKNIDFI